MSKYVKYPSYRDSGVEWLGEIPEHWELWKMSHAFNTIGSGTTPSSTNEEYYNGHIPWVTTGELRENIIVKTKKLLTLKALTDNSSLKLFPSDSIVIAMYGATIGRLGILGIPATTNQACCVMTDSIHMINKYLYYWLMGCKTEIIALGYGGGQPNISQDTIINLKVSAPSISEQQAIANYLDSATAKIDTLIEKQTKLIALLKEKRQAVISTAVTRGLDNTVAMKDSGVEWLGEIPEHWSRKKLGAIAMQPKNSFVDGPFGSDLKSNEYKTSGIPLIQLNNIKDGIHLLKHMKFITDEKKEQLSRHIARQGDIVIAKMAEPVARATIVNSKYDEYVIVADCVRLTPDLSKINTSFLIYAINSKPVRTGAELVSTGTTRIRVNLTELKKLWIPYPELLEQENIANHLDNKTSKIDTLITKATKAIELLKEKRIALISSAVTGKIDVREIA